MTFRSRRLVLAPKNVSIIFIYSFCVFVFLSIFIHGNCSRSTHFPCPSNWKTMALMNITHPTWICFASISVIGSYLSFEHCTRICANVLTKRLRALCSVQRIHAINLCRKKKQNKIRAVYGVIVESSTNSSWQSRRFEVIIKCMYLPPTHIHRFDDDLKSTCSFKSTNDLTNSIWKSPTLANNIWHLMQFVCYLFDIRSVFDKCFD